MSFPESNLTYKILKAATEGNYAVPAFNVYNTDALLGAIRAAEELNAPCMVEVFPWSLHFQGGEFIRFAAEACHNAKVPIALHLDHCLEEEDINIALELPFDSIMVDAGTSDPDTNIAFVASVVGRAAAKGITIEAEMGRINGSEDGLPPVNMEELYTDPEYAAEFMTRTGAHFLAPSFGNVHGPYPEGGPLKYWQLDRIAKIKELCPSEIPLVIHGTNPIVQQLIDKMINLGARKINMNRNLYVHYRKFLAENSETLEMTKLQEGAVEAFKKGAMEGLRITHCDGKYIK